MNRRDFLQTAGLASASLAFPDAATLLAGDQTSAPADANWRSFEVITRVEILKPAGVARIWLPAALTTETPFQKTLSNTLNADDGAVKLIESKPDALGVISAEFPEGAKPVVTSISRISTRNYRVEVSAVGNPSGARQKTPADLDYFLRPTKLLPTDGIVRKPRPTKSQKARAPTSKKRALSTNGSSRTRSAIPKREAAERATSGSCSKPAT